MGDVLAVVSKAVFEKTARGLGVGDTHPIASYDSNPAAFSALAEGGTLYVVTARPGDVLWLVAILEQPKLKGSKWLAAANTTPITDVTNLVGKLKFASGHGIHAKPGQLGMSLQTPRGLAATDIALLDKALARPRVAAPVAKPKPVAKRKPIAKLAPAPTKPLKLSSVSTGNNKALLAAVLADPDDDLPRAIYADWLQQRGDPRGELITMQLEIAKLAPADRHRKTLEVEAQALLKQHRKAWQPKQGSYVFERGFAVLWKVDITAFPKHAAAVFATEPIQTLDLSQSSIENPTGDARPAFKRPELLRLRRLELRRLRIPVDVFAKIVKSPQLANVRELDLERITLSRTSIDAIARAAAFSKLEVLDASGTRLDDAFALALDAAPFAASLRHLNLAGSSVRAPGAIAIASSKKLALESLELGGCKLAKSVREDLQKRLGKVVTFG